MANVLCVCSSQVKNYKITRNTEYMFSTHTGSNESIMGIKAPCDPHIRTHTYTHTHTHTTYIHTQVEYNR